MTEPLVSVIMSTYNESLDELRKSVDSVLNQTYKNFEFIIVNDNPENEQLDSFLNKLIDKRIIIQKNKTNIGLVRSLNHALELCKGNYIARIDADDVALPERLEKQLRFLTDNDLDFIGADIQLIDENNVVIKYRMHFPSDETRIRKEIKWGNCIPHPTWLVKKEVFLKLNGYRNINTCEDYDFILRALKNNIRVGNIPEICLKYRVRQNSISQSNSSEQLLLRMFLSKHMKTIDNISEDEVLSYKQSEQFQRDLEKYEKYEDDWKEFKNRKLNTIFRLMTNKYTYLMRIERFHQKKREKMN